MASLSLLADRTVAITIFHAMYFIFVLNTSPFVTCIEQDVLFDLILYVPSTIFQLYSYGSSFVEPVLS